VAPSPAPTRSIDPPSALRHIPRTPPPCLTFLDFHALGLYCTIHTVRSHPRHDLSSLLIAQSFACRNSQAHYLLGPLQVLTALRIPIGLACEPRILARSRPSRIDASIQQKHDITPSIRSGPPRNAPFCRSQIKTKAPRSQFKPYEARLRAHPAWLPIMNCHSPRLSSPFWRYLPRPLTP
jgi:hypothetical protein